jgi:hypothetical protein
LAIVEKYDKIYLFLFKKKCYYHLHLLVKAKKGIIDLKVKKDKSLEIFEMTINTSEPTTKLINSELLIFRHYQVDVKNIKSCSL